MQFDVIIIGAGIMGSSTAFQLVEKNKKCLLIDQFPLGHAYGSSHGDTRIIRRSYPEDHFANLMISAYDLWHGLEKRYNDKFIITAGGLDFGNENSLGMKNVVQTVENMELEHEILDNKEIMKKFPAFALEKDTYGLYQAEAGIVLASKALNFFQNIGQKKGLEILTGEKVSQIREENDHVVVSTSKKKFNTKKVVICAGSWINNFFKDLNIKHRTTVLPVNFGYWLVKKPELFKISKFPIFIYWSEKTFYGFPILEKDNRIKMGAHYTNKPTEFRNESLDKHFDKEIIHDMDSFILKTFPEAISNDHEIDSCFYTQNDEENFILDLHPENSDIIFGGGFSGHGFKFAPLIGEILSELAIEGKTQYDLTYFKILN